MTYNRKTITRVSVAAGDLVTLAEVKAFLRLDGTAEDTMLQMFIDAAIDGAEQYTRRALREQTIDYAMDGFPRVDDDALDRIGAGVHNLPLSHFGGDGYFDLPLAPIKSVTSITTYARDNSATVFPSASYLLDGFRVSLNSGYSWPTGLRDNAAVITRYVAGYGPTDLPRAIKMAILQHVAAMYECRMGCEAPQAARGALNAYRLMDGLTW